MYSSGLPGNTQRVKCPELGQQTWGRPAGLRTFRGPHRVSLRDLNISFILSRTCMWRVCVCREGNIMEQPQTHRLLLPPKITSAVNEGRLARLTTSGSEAVLCFLCCTLARLPWYSEGLCELSHFPAQQQHFLSFSLVVVRGGNIPLLAPGVFPEDHLSKHTFPLPLAKLSAADLTVLWYCL